MSIINVTDRKGFLKLIARDAEIVKGLRGKEYASKLYDEVLSYSDSDRIPEERWKEFEIQSFGVVVEVYPIWNPTTIRRH